MRMHEGWNTIKLGVFEVRASRPVIEQVAKVARIFELPAIVIDRHDSTAS